MTRQAKNTLVHKQAKSIARRLGWKIETRGLKEVQLLDKKTGKPVSEWMSLSSGSADAFLQSELERVQAREEKEAEERRRAKKS